MLESRSGFSELITSTFVLDDMVFGIEVEKVREAIFYSGSVLKLPTGLDIFEGVINLRGTIIPIMNMRKRFGLSTSYDEKSKCIAVVNYKNNYIGLMFDDINQVVSINNFNVSYFSQQNINDEYFADKGVVMLEHDNKIFQILDLDLLFKDYDIQLLDNFNLESKKSFLEIKQNITFCLDEQEYALEMSDIKEIVNISKIKNKVEHSYFVKGVIELRNDLIPIVDLKRYFSETDTKIQKDSKIIILKSEPAFGIIVDSIKEVIHYEVDKLLPINHSLNNKLRDAFTNIISLSENRNIIKLNIEHLFTTEDKNQIEKGVLLNKEFVQEDKNENITAGAIDSRILGKEFIIFKLKDVFALEIGDFQEIIKYNGELVEILGCEKYIAGILNLRAEAIVVFDLRKYYNLEPFKAFDNERILILSKFGKKIGIIVDEVLEILKTDRTTVTKTPKIAVGKSFNEFKNLVKDVLCVQKESEKSSLVIQFDVAGFMASVNFEDIDEYIETAKKLESKEIINIESSEAIYICGEENHSESPSASTIEQDQEQEQDEGEDVFFNFKNEEN